MIMRVRIDSSDPIQQFREIGSANLEFINDTHAQTFAETLEGVTRVDTGELAESVGAEGPVAGYGINFPQRIGKMLAAHNFERFVLATRLSALPIRIQTGQAMQGIIRAARRSGTSLRGLIRRRR